MYIEVDAGLYKAFFLEFVDEFIEKERDGRLGDVPAKLSRLLWLETWNYDKDKRKVVVLFSPRNRDISPLYFWRHYMDAKKHKKSFLINAQVFAKALLYIGITLPVNDNKKRDDVQLAEDLYEIFKDQNPTVPMDEDKEDKTVSPVMPEPKVPKSILPLSSNNELYSRLRDFNKLLDFKYDKPESYFKISHYSKEVYDLLEAVKKKGINDNIDSYYLRQKLADFYDMTNQREIGIKLHHDNFNILPNIFNPDSLQYKEEYYLAMHNMGDWKNLNMNAVSYCQLVWGTNSAKTLEALTCKACLAIKLQDFDNAKSVLALCESIISDDSFDPNEIEKRVFHLDFNYGKVYFFEAKFYKDSLPKMKDLLENAIEHFNRAIDNYGAYTDNINIKYIEYYLFECYRLLGREKEMNYYFEAFSSFFRYHPISSICHIDKEELDRAMRLV